MEEVHRQLREAMSGAVAGAQLQPDGPGTRDSRSVHAMRGQRALRLYRQWFETASDPEHSAALSAQFLGCWNAALRFRRQADRAALASPPGDVSVASDT